jgi:hypothetical protein
MTFRGRVLWPAIAAAFLLAVAGAFVLGRGSVSEPATAPSSIPRLVSEARAIAIATAEAEDTFTEPKPGVGASLRVVGHRIVWDVVFDGVCPPWEGVVPSGQPPPTCGGSHIDIQIEAITGEQTGEGWS